VDDRVWRNVSVVLGVVCAVLIGVAGAILIVDNKNGSTPTSGPDSSDLATATTSEGPGSVASASLGTISAPTPSPTPGEPAAAATITFNQMKLDATNDTKGFARTFTFITDGPGPVTWAITKNSAGGTSRMCAKVDNSAFTCKVGGLMSSKGAMSDSTPDKPSTWTVTFLGYGNSAPTVDIAITWPTTSPKITLTHGRLQGSSTEGVSEFLNGFTATFKPRAAGVLNVQASWTIITADIGVSLSDTTSTPAVTVDDRQYKTAQYLTPAYTFNVDATKTYTVKLRNESADSGRPDLTAQITFP
jgi:hypothetical protein